GDLRRGQGHGSSVPERPAGTGDVRQVHPLARFARSHVMNSCLAASLRRARLPRGPEARLSLPRPPVLSLRQLFGPIVVPRRRSPPMSVRHPISGLVLAVVVLLGWTLPVVADETKKPADASVSDLSLEVQALHLLQQLNLTTEQMKALQKLAKETAQ